MVTLSPAAAIVVDPDIQGGTPCFAGTRVPVRSLFDALERGRTIDYFVEQFPSVGRDQAAAVLRGAAAPLVRRHADANAGSTCRA